MYKKILQETGHRDSPLPAGPWMMTQKWDDLLFLHLPASPETIRRYVPDQMELDTYDGEAWVSIIPFKISDMRIRLLPSFPYIRKFLELNVRTYVKRDGIPGIYFFSLDAEKLLPVLGARMGTLPYYYANMGMKKRGDWFHYHSKRHGNRELAFKGRYRPMSESRFPEKGTLDHWLLERYYLWTQVKDHVFTVGIHHLPWKVADAEAIIEKQGLTPFLPAEATGNRMLLHYAHSRRVLFWPLKKA
ncbi:YqjF family protein [Virgibacillus xinjiangensis]|uniref:YqjF family protein n=1 Tax=Virgibacillus xinjiangensis TaxID=393090 RepID=A0ABV7CQI5_9BACI